MMENLFSIKGHPEKLVCAKAALGASFISEWF